MSIRPLQPTSGARATGLIQYRLRRPRLSGRSLGGQTTMLMDEDISCFHAEQALHEAKYLNGTNPREQSGFGRDELDWECFRRIVLAPVRSDGTFLDIGCANGLLMESAVKWAREEGYALDVYGLDISAKLVALARDRLPEWRDRFFVGNALLWEPPHRFDCVRTELAYVPSGTRREYVFRLLDMFVAPSGRLLICSYGRCLFVFSCAMILAPALPSSGAVIEALKMTFEPLQPQGLPAETFSTRGKMTFDKEALEYVPVDPAHTDGDAYVFFPGPNVLHTGDLFFGNRYPFIDYSTGGCIGGMVAATESMYKVCDAETRVIPGHGSLSTRDDLGATRDMLALVHDRLQAFAKKGANPEEVVKAAPVKDLDEQWGRGFMSPENFVRIAYTSLLRRKPRA